MNVFKLIFKETAEEKLIVNDLKSVYHYVKSGEVCTCHLISMTYINVVTQAAYLFSWQQLILECNQ